MKGKLDTSERIQALVMGPPAYVLRRRRIEDLQASILEFIRACEAKTGNPMSCDAPPAQVGRSLEQLHQLIQAHNAYYPIEAGLPIAPMTGALLDWGRRWEPLPLPTLDDLIAMAR